MAILSKGKTFTSGDQVTATSLNELVDNATFASGSVDDSTTQLSNGRIIVKDAGITSSKLNLSVNGASQNIAQFKTVQGSSARALNIRTPASTSDITSPFEIQTANAVKFIVDDHTVTIDSDGKTTFGNGSIVTSDTALHQVNINTDDALGATAGNSQGILRLVETTGNQDNLLFTSQRVSNGSDWTTAAHRIQRKVDATKMGYIQFGNHTSSSGGLITFGENETERMRIDAEGHVGIGTASPTEELHVVSNSNSASTTLMVENQGTHQANIKVKNSEGQFALLTDGGEFKIYDDIDAASRLVIDTSGKVGIGTTSPSSKLDVVDSNTTVSLKASGTIQAHNAGQATRAYGFLSIDEGEALVGGNLRLDESTGGTHAGFDKGTNLRGASAIKFSQPTGGASGVISFLTSPDTDNDSYAVNETMRISSDGNLGIGSISPSNKLQVASNNRFFYVGESGVTNYAQAGFRQSNNTPAYGNFTGYDINFKTGTTDSGLSTIMHLDNDGKVGIGTTSPNYALDVEITGGDTIPIGIKSGTTESYVSLEDTNTTAGHVRVGSVGNSLALRAGNATRIFAKDNGNVGIGTTGPDGKLHVGTGTNSDGTDIDIVLGGDTANSRQAIITKKIQSSDRALEIYASGNASDEDIRFFSDTGTERMRIMSTGNVGIGVTDPSAPLEVAGNIHCKNIVGREEEAGLIIQSDPEGTNASTGGSQIALYSKQFSALDPLPAQAYYNAQFHTFGNLDGLGNTTGISLGGNFTSSGTVTCSSLIETSDRRLKDNITPLTGSLDKICQLNPVSYNDLTDEDKTLEFGLIAQDVQSIFPNLVRENVQEQIPEAERGESYLGVHYTQLISPLIESIKELKSENEALKTRVAALES